MEVNPRLLYCNCTYARVVPRATAAGVLRKLCDSEASFDAVADLCEMSARNDPMLQEMARGGPIKIAACFPRAVHWLFSAADAPLDRESTEVVNLRSDSVDEAVDKLFRPGLQPNLPLESSPAAAPEKES